MGRICSPDRTQTAIGSKHIVLVPMLTLIAAYGENTENALRLSVLSIWIIFSCVAGAIARNRGNSFALAFLISILLSPLIGIVVALVQKPNEAAIELDRLQTGLSKRCPFCAELIKKDAVVCRYCGRDINPQSETSVSIEEQIEESWQKSGITRPQVGTSLATENHAASGAVTNIFVWMLSLSPLSFLVILWVGYLNGWPSWGGWALGALCVLPMWIDQALLKQAGIAPPSKDWLPPQYAYERAKLMGDDGSYFWVSCITWGSFALWFLWSILYGRYLILSYYPASVFGVVIFWIGTSLAFLFLSVRTAQVFIALWIAGIVLWEATPLRSLHFITYEALLAVLLFVMLLREWGQQLWQKSGITREAQSTLTLSRNDETHSEEQTKPNGFKWYKRWQTWVAVTATAYVLWLVLPHITSQFTGRAYTKSLPPISTPKAKNQAEIWSDLYRKHRIPKEPYEYRFENAAWREGYEVGSLHRANGEPFLSSKQQENIRDLKGEDFYDGYVAGYQDATPR